MTAFKTSFITKEELPLVIQPSSNEKISLSEFIEILAGNKEFLKSSLLKYGGLLFRGFPIHDEDDFGAFIRGFGTGKFIDYIGGDSPRNKIREGIYTSTEAPPSIKIPLHNELSFVKNYPKHIYFYCQVPPKEKGETIIGDARKIYHSIDKRVRRKFMDKGLKYISCYYYQSKIMDYLNKLQRSHKTWLDVFETHDKQEVEQKCFENDFALKWHKNDWLQISQSRPAVIHHPKTQEKIWFNQVHLYDFNPKLLGWWRYLAAKAIYCQKHTKLHEVYFGDGTKIPRDEIYHVMQALDDNTVYFQWQKGDVLVLDNILTMHGRSAFQGRRRVLTAMTS